MLELVTKSKSGYYLIYEVRSKILVKRLLENILRHIKKNPEYCYKSNPKYRIYSSRNKKFLKTEYSSVKDALNYIDRR